MRDTKKPIEFLGSSLDDLRDFPVDARQEAGYQLYRIQHGDDAHDGKPMHVIGPGVKEIRVRDASNQYLVIYIAKFAAAVFVLHCFQKKTQKTTTADLDLAKTRYLALLKELKR